VDDGSESAGLEAVRALAAKSPQIKLIEKANGGQLSCFQAGLDASDSEVVLFLDADDLWEPSYVQSIADLLEEKPDIDFVATNNREFYTDGTDSYEELPNRDMGYAIVRSLARGGVWLGSPTSGIAVRRKILDQIFPVPNTSAWRVCADEALVYGSSIAGAHMYFLGEPLVRYRVHGSNAFFGKKDTVARAYFRRLEGRRLIEHMRKKLSLPTSLVEMIHYELRTIENPTKNEYGHCWASVKRSNVSMMRKLRLYSGLFAQYHFGWKI
jgi:glycosyltransferase involved in cell wall biosynthesis